MTISLLSKAVSWMRGILLRWLSKHAPKNRIHGILVVDIIEAESAEERFFKLRQAFQLIERFDPLRMRMIRRELAQIVLFESGPEYWPASRACVLYDIRQVNAIDIALHIIHETAHARLWRRGFRYAPEIRDRIERACVASEIRFLEKVPDSTDLKKEAQEKLEKRWWTTDHIKTRGISDLKTLKAPRWVVRLLDRMVR